MTGSDSRTPPPHVCGSRTIRHAIATRIGGRDANADAAAIVLNPPGVGAAVIDGVGTTPEAVAAARLAADVAAVVATHKSAQGGMMAAVDTMPDYPGAPNAVGSVVSIEPGGRIAITHAGDSAVWTWSTATGLRRWTTGETAGAHVAHVLTNHNPTGAARDVLDRYGMQVADALDDFILQGLAFATTSTISWTPLRGEHADPELILLTSDGVHKPLSHSDIRELIDQHTGDAQGLADALVDTAVAVPPAEEGDRADNATAAVLMLSRTA